MEAQSKTPLLAREQVGGAPSSWQNFHPSEELGCAFNKIYFENLYYCMGEEGPQISGGEVSHDLLQNS